MPRAHMRVEERQRSARACLSCKTSKIRCDSELPCTSCIRRGRTDTCTYGDPFRNNRFPPHKGHRTQNRASRAQGAKRASDAHQLPSEQPPSVVSATSPISAAGSSTGNPAAAYPSPDRGAMCNQQSQAAYTDRGTISFFLDFLRETVRRHVGSTPFSEGKGFDSMLEEEDYGEHESAQLDQDTTTKRDLFRSFLEVTSGILDVFTLDEFIELIGSDSPSKPCESRREDNAAASVAMAIGAQALGKSRRALANAFFANGQKTAFEGLLQHARPSTVRLFVLMAYYMLGACRKTTAVIYLGVASKAAMMLGFHELGSRYDVGERNKTSSQQIWQSLQILDTLLSCLVGTTGGLPEIHSVDQVQESTKIRDIGFNTTLRGCGVLAELNQRQLQGTRVDISGAEEILEKLQGFGKDISRDLHPLGELGQLPCTSQARQDNLAKFYASCLYYLGVALVTRPFLMFTLRHRLNGGTMEDTKHILDPRIPRLAQACVVSAKYLVAACKNLTACDNLFAKMWLVQLWSLMGGLTLGFAILSGETGQDLKDGFDDAAEILSQSEHPNPAGGQIYNAMRTFKDVINRQQEQQAEERRRVALQYVDQLATIGSTQPGPIDSGMLLENVVGLEYDDCFDWSIPDSLSELDPLSSLGIAKDEILVELSGDLQIDYGLDLGAG